MKGLQWIWLMIAGLVLVSGIRWGWQLAAVTGAWVLGGIALGAVLSFVLRRRGR